MKLTDGTKTVTIEMYEEDFPDCSLAFFHAKNLKIVGTIDGEPVFKAAHVDRFIELAHDWAAYEGSSAALGEWYEVHKMKRPARDVFVFEE